MNSPDGEAKSPEPGWVAVALLGKTRGNRGEITAFALSSKPERFRNLQEVHLFGPGELLAGKRYAVESTWFHNGTLVFKFRGVDTITDAERLLALGIESATLRKQVYKKLSLKYLCDVRQDIKDQIVREIDAQK